MGEIFSKGGDDFQPNSLSCHVTEVTDVLPACQHPCPSERNLPWLPSLLKPSPSCHSTASCPWELNSNGFLYQETFFVNHTVCPPKGHGYLQCLLICLSHSLPVLYLKSRRHMPYSPKLPTRSSMPPGCPADSLLHPHGPLGHGWLSEDSLAPWMSWFVSSRVLTSHWARAASYPVSSHL